MKFHFFPLFDMSCKYTNKVSSVGWFLLTFAPKFATTMWLIFAFLSACLLGLYDISKKLSLTNNALIPVLWANTLFCFVLFLPFLTGSSMGWIDADALLYVPSGNFHLHLLVMFKALIVLSSWALGYFGIKHLPITLTGPIHATRPVMVLAGAVIVFNEHLNAWQWTGVILAVISFFMMSRSSQKEGISFSHNKWVICIIMAAATGAASALYDKYLLLSTLEGGAGLPPMFVQTWSNLYQLLFMSLVLILLWWPRRRKETPFQWRWAIVFIAIFLSVADGLYYYSLHSPGAMVSIVSMVRRGSVVVSFAAGALFFKEQHIRSKALDLLLVLASMLCLWMGTH